MRKKIKQKSPYLCILVCSFSTAITKKCFYHKTQEERLNHNTVKSGHKNARSFSRNLPKFLAKKKNFDEEFKSVCESEPQARGFTRIFL